MWYGVLTVKSKQKLSRVVNVASTIVGKTKRQLRRRFRQPRARKNVHRMSFDVMLFEF